MVQASRPSLAEQSTTRIGLRELERAVRTADPSAILVPSRILRRVIKQHTLVPGFGLRVPHRKSYVLGRSSLLSIVDEEELDLPEGVTLPDIVILLARPPAERLVVNSAAANLTTCWRLLFHARIHRALDREIADGRLTAATVRERIDLIGATEFAEIRAVLKQEDFLLPPADDLTTYVEFAALFLELRYFATSFLSSYFPGIEDLDRVEKLLAGDVDAESLLQATRLPGAPEIPERRDMATDDVAKAAAELPPSRYKPSMRAVRRYMDKATKAQAKGNYVRAAILCIAAAERGTTDQSRVARSEARAQMDRLADRLQAALRFDEEEREEWARSLAVLAAGAARGFWTVEARMLYDLQKVCVDHERGIYTFDVYRWITTGFRAPLKRPLPGQRSVMFSKHLRAAARRLSAVRISGRVRARMAALLQAAVERAEEQLRSRFRPPIVAAFDSVKLTPHNLPERVARDKLIDEMLDRIVERGFLTMGDLRDALSRNNLKVPDLTNARQFLLGDQLLVANRHLADDLDGVYHRGEVYLTFPQRLSSLAFGTPLGRFLTQYIVLPFGGAFLVQKGLQHVIAPHAEQSGNDPVSLAALVYTGLFLLGLLHHHGFRMMCLDVLLASGRLLRALVVEWPARLLQLPVVQAIVRSLYFRLLTRGLIKPMVVTAVIVACARLGFARTITTGNSLAIFLVVNLILNSRIGRNVDELVTDWVVQSWHRFRIRVLTALLRSIMEFFSRMLENIEAMLYTVDEWLRFRTGEGPFTIVAKAVLGLVWFFINYFIRFCVNLLIEPQINPIKHFPVVTVSHKILIPLTGTFVHIFEGALGRVAADTVAATIVLSLPGVMGFLVWELKENWRLYGANRPKNLGPVTIGQHGEGMIQFMKPGFRSGTLPKLFAKLRRANRKAYWTGKWKNVGKQVAGLHHVEQSLRRFVDRELVALLKHSRGVEEHAIVTGEIAMGTNRVSVELRCPDLSVESLWIAFYEQSGWLLAAVERRGWLDALNEPMRSTLDNALVGLYKLAGVDLVRDQLAAQLDPREVGYDVDEEGLAAWPLRSPHDVTRYAMRDWPPAPRPAGPRVVLPALPDIEPERLIFARAPLAWDRWVAAWRTDPSRGAAFRHVLEGISLLPPRP